MTSVIVNISVDCADPFALAQFWSGVLGLPVADEDEPGDDEVGIDLPDGRTLLFLRVPEPKTVKNRLHLCVTPDDPPDPARTGATRDAEIERLLGAGATVVDDRRTPDGKGWAVLADPEGNEFCVVRPAAEQRA